MDPPLASRPVCHLLSGRTVDDNEVGESPLHRLGLGIDGGQQNASRPFGSSNAQLPVFELAGEMPNLLAKAFWLNPSFVLIARTSTSEGTWTR
jgi:hypothetical protein